MENNNNNFNLTGDEARILMASLLNSNVQTSAGALLQLYLRLAFISSVQPQK